MAALAGARLEVRSLRDPEVAEWRVRALGAGVPWEPTLLRVEGEEVRAWTGRGLVWRVWRLLGPGKALALAERLVAVQAATGAGVTRRGFLGKVAAAGAVLGILLSGKLAVSTAVQASSRVPGGASVEPPWWAVPSVQQAEVYGAAQQQLRERALDFAVPQAVLGARGGSPASAEERAVEHVLADGRRLRAVAVALGAEEVLAYYEDDAERRAALRWRIVEQGGKPDVRLLAASAGALPGRKQAQVGVMQADCSEPWVPCGCCCGSFDWAALFTCCFPCAISCLRDWLTCLVCLVTVCPVCIYTACPGGWTCTCCCWPY